MKFRVLIHVDSLRRDAATCITLAELLRMRGHDTVVSGQQTTGLYLKYWRPHLMLHTAATKIVNYAKLGLLIGPTRPLVHFVPQEGRPTSPDTIDVCYRPFEAVDYELVDQVYVWNKVHYDWLMQHSPLPRERVRIVGGFRLDLAKYGTQPNLRDRPAVIGFVGRFTALNPHDGDYGLHLTAGTMAKLRHKLPKISEQVRACMIYSYLITALIEQTDFTVSLRPHHNEYPHAHFYIWAKKRFGDRIEIDNHLSFYEWSAGKLALITTTSSTFAETYVARTPQICIDRIIDFEVSWRYSPSTEEICKSYQDQHLPKTFEEIFDLLRQLNDNFEPAPLETPAGDLIKQQYMWPYEGSSLRAVADGIEQALDTMDDQLRRTRPMLPKVVGDVVYAVGMAKWIRAGNLRPRLNYVYNDLLHGRNAFFKQVAARINEDKAYQYVEEQT